GIVFAKRRRKGLAILGQGHRIDRIEHQEVVLQQSINERSAGLLETNGEGLSLKAGAQCQRPIIQGFRRVFDGGFFTTTSGFVIETDGVFLISPIDRNQGGKVFHLWFLRLVVL